MRAQIGRLVGAATFVAIAAVAVASLALFLDRHFSTTEAREARLEAALEDADIPSPSVDISESGASVSVRVDDADCETWFGIAVDVLTVVEASDAADHDLAVSVFDGEDEGGQWASASMDDLHHLEAAASVCEVEGVTGFTFSAGHVALIGPVTLAATQEAASLLDSAGLQLLLREAPDA